MRQHTFASFWAGSPLSFFEQVCAQSFLDHGYDFHLYTHGEVQNVPAGVIIHDAAEIMNDTAASRQDQLTKENQPFLGRP